MFPKSMNAAVAYELGIPLQIEDMPVGIPWCKYEILVKVVASDVCYTDCLNDH